MSNYHMEVKPVSRLKGRSITQAVSYIRGENLYDQYEGKMRYHNRDDVLWKETFLPADAPASFYDPQTLCNEIDAAEKRYDARTAKEFICSLPNELPLDELTQIVEEFIDQNFVEQGLCATAAIHAGKNKDDPERNNPHAHILVSTRELGPEGFNKKKDREHDKRAYLNLYREQWGKLQNRAYERNGLDIRVSHESLEVQGKYGREPLNHLSRMDWQREQRGERTAAGERRRAIQRKNERRLSRKQRIRDRGIEMER